jgi:hypothetical protein
LPLDPSIPLKVNQAIPESPLDQQYKRQQIRTMGEALRDLPVQRQQQQQMNQMKMEAGQLEMMLNKQRAVTQALSGANDQAGWDAGLQWASSQGLPVEGIPRQFDPRLRDQLLLRSMDAEKQLDYKLKQQAMGERARHNRAMESRGMGSGASIETDEDGNVTYAPAQGKPPSGYRYRQDGSLEPIPGGPAEKMTAEAASRGALLDQSIGNLPNVRKVMEKVNALSTADWVRDAGKVGEAKRQVRAGVESALRVMSGAAVPETEVERYSDLFMPRLDDSPATKQKKLNELEAFMSSASAGMKKGRGGDASNPNAAMGALVDDQGFQATPSGIKYRIVK